MNYGKSVLLNEQADRHANIMEAQWAWELMTITIKPATKCLITDDDVVHIQGDTCIHIHRSQIDRYVLPVTECMRSTARKRNTGRAVPQINYAINTSAIVYYNVGNILVLREFLHSARSEVRVTPVSCLQSPRQAAGDYRYLYRKCPPHTQRQEKQATYKTHYTVNVNVLFTTPHITGAVIKVCGGVFVASITFSQLAVFACRQIAHAMFTIFHQKSWIIAIFCNRTSVGRPAPPRKCALFLCYHVLS